MSYLNTAAETEIEAHYLAKLADEVYAWAESKGWEPDPNRTFGDECALLHSEVSEALEAYRDYKFEDPTVPGGKPEGVGSELADVFIRLLHTCRVREFNLEAEYRRKMEYNRTRTYCRSGLAL